MRTKNACFIEYYQGYRYITLFFRNKQITHNLLHMLKKFYFLCLLLALLTSNAFCNNKLLSTGSVESNHELALKPLCSCEQGTIKPLEDKAITHFLKQLKTGWFINKEGNLERIFRFNNYLEAISFANKITPIAQEANHHPILRITWGKVNAEFTTLSLGKKLTHLDFILAARVSQITQ